MAGRGCEFMRRISIRMRLGSKQPTTSHRLVSGMHYAEAQEHLINKTPINKLMRATESSTPIGKRLDLKYSKCKLDFLDRFGVP